MKDYVFQLWWVQHPRVEGVTVGTYTCPNRGFTRDYKTFLLLLLNRVNVDDVMLFEYAHGSNWGEAIHFCFDPQSHERYSMLPVEKGDFKAFAQRVDTNSGYPICSWHRYILDLVDDHQVRVPYAYEASYDQVIAEACHELSCKEV